MKALIICCGHVESVQNISDIFSFTWKMLIAWFGMPAQCGGISATVNKSSAGGTGTGRGAGGNMVCCSGRVSEWISRSNLSQEGECRVNVLYVKVSSAFAILWVSSHFMTWLNRWWRVHWPLGLLANSDYKCGYMQDTSWSTMQNMRCEI